MLQNYVAHILFPGPVVSDKKMRLLDMEWPDSGLDVGEWCRLGRGYFGLVLKRPNILEARVPLPKWPEFLLMKGSVAWTELELKSRGR